MKYWLIYFEDSERDVEVYTDEAIAMRVFEERSLNWNCILFVSVKSNVST